MRAYELMEGGWESTITQGTKITPSIVKSALKLVERFTNLRKNAVWLSLTDELR